MGVLWRRSMAPSVACSMACPMAYATFYGAVYGAVHRCGVAACLRCSLAACAVQSQHRCSNSRRIRANSASNGLPGARIRAEFCCFAVQNASGCCVGSSLETPQSRPRSRCRVAAWYQWSRCRLEPGCVAACAAVVPLRVAAAVWLRVVNCRVSPLGRRVSAVQRRILLLCCLKRCDELCRGLPRDSSVAIAGPLLRRCLVSMESLPVRNWLRCDVFYHCAAARPGWCSAWRRGVVFRRWGGECLWFSVKKKTEHCSAVPGGRRSRP